MRAITVTSVAIGILGFRGSFSFCEDLPEFKAIPSFELQEGFRVVLSSAPESHLLFQGIGAWDSQCHASSFET